ncbi:MAG: 5-(carboxyamino)imidazole ribonucleotide mutase [Nitrospirae bacterium]|nr:5-(carboxyamino)imidazole ribonucleotide mutase [Nitrospirota bacterium]
MSKPLVAIIMGSESDMPIMKAAADILEKFNVPYELKIASAHRSPRLVQEFSRGAEESGLEVIIAGAGGAAHLPGVIASETVIPVIGVPIDSTSLKGIDALLSIAQMPGGVPVAAMAIGIAGAKNAALFAVQIISRKDEALLNQFKKYKEDMAIAVEEKNQRVGGRR